MNGLQRRWFLPIAAAVLLVVAGGCASGDVVWSGSKSGDAGVPRDVVDSPETADGLPDPDATTNARDDDTPAPDAATGDVCDAASDGEQGPPWADTSDSGETPAALDVEVLERLADPPWAWTERCHVAHAALHPERFVDKTRHSDDRVIAAFGGEVEPPAGRFLLHAAEGWDTAGGAPVLLVHGAGSHARQSFVEPDPLGLQTGLVDELVAADRPVFAVTFAARFGDTTNQAIVLAAALQRVRAVTGAAAVDVVAHSKGGYAVFAYAGGLLAGRGIPYAGDLGNVVLAGVPLGGMDFSFRHPAFNYASAVWGFELPSSWDQMLLFGVWQDRHDTSIYGGAYDGLLQTLARWDHVHALPMIEQDWHTTYEGGQGFVSHSLGIDAAIAQGGDFVARLRSARLPEGLAVSLLVGTKQLVGGLPWETSGPSDGLVFTASAGDGDWVRAAGARLAGLTELRLNHWELVYAAAARVWIHERLDGSEELPLVTGCVGDGDGRITAEEFPVDPRAGVEVLHSVNLPGVTAHVPDPGGRWEDGTLWWYFDDFDDQRDHVVSDALLPLDDFWFAGDFPDADYAAAADAEGNVLAIYRVDREDGSLTVLGSASVAEGVTSLRYDKPVPVLRFPLEQGASWEALGVQARGTHEGTDYPLGTLRLRHDYRFTVDLVGKAQVPAGTFDVLRVALDFDARAENMGFAVGSERRMTYLYVAECVGLVARLRSRADESDPAFREATEYRRVGFPLDEGGGR